MLTFNKILVITLLATLAATIKAEEITNVEKHVEEAKPSEAAILTQLKFQESDSKGLVFEYICSVGSIEPNDHVACTANDDLSWDTPQNVVLKLRCPDAGSDFEITYAEVNFKTTSLLSKCEVSDGGVGFGHIEISVEVLGTTTLQYDAIFRTF